MIVADDSVLVYFWLPSAFAEWAEAAKAQDGVWAAPVLLAAMFVKSWCVPVGA